MSTVKISDRLTVAGQPELPSLFALAAQGFAAVVNNRPDGEEA
eukprot:gene33892-43486_t